MPVLKRSLGLSLAAESAHLRPRRTSSFEPMSVCPQRLAFRSLRRQLEHLTLLNHRRNLLDRTTRSRNHSAMTTSLYKRGSTVRLLQRSLALPPAQALDHGKRACVPRFGADLPSHERRLRKAGSRSSSRRPERSASARERGGRPPSRRVRDQAQRRCLTVFVRGVSTPPLSSGYPACSQSAMPPA